MPRTSSLLFVAFMALAHQAASFVLPSPSLTPAGRVSFGARSSFVPSITCGKALAFPRPGRSSSVTMGLFGLGAPEVAVIVVVAALILGPEKMAGVAKDVGKMAGELKEVPKEFQAGIEEGEQQLNIKKSGEKAPAVEEAEVADK
ncbi:unnamed protein product [Chrysoparadoxa australica]